jgi:hypothetical protein
MEMPKIQGTLADVSTTYVMIEPDTYEMKVKEVDLQEKPPTSDLVSGQLTHIIKSVVDQPGHEHHNKPVTDYINWYKKDGTVNEYSQAQVKRYFEATLGEERANGEDLDTDELIGQRFMAEVYIDSYVRKDGSGGETNRLKNVVPIE